MKLSDNFTLEEMIASGTAKAKGIDNTPSETVVKNLEKLTKEVLQPIREKYGKAIKVNSAFRCKALNTAVGGSKTSQHLTGCAADIKPVSGTVKSLFECVEKMVKGGEIVVGQLIDEYGYKWVHVSLQSATKKNQILHLK